MSCIDHNLDAMSPRCVLCDRAFDSDDALQQHKQDSPAHAFDCTTCDRHFGSDTALVQLYEIRPSMLHSSTVTTAIDPLKVRKLYCSTYETRSHMLQPSTVKSATDPSAVTRCCSSICETHPCMLRPSSMDSSFGSNEVLEQHLQDSPEHAPSLHCNRCRCIRSREG